MEPLGGRRHGVLPKIPSLLVLCLLLINYLLLLQFKVQERTGLLSDEPEPLHLIDT